MKSPFLLLLTCLLANDAIGQSLRLSAPAGQIEIHANAPTGQGYFLEQSTTLAPSDWSPLLGGAMSQEGWRWNEAAAPGARFFRLRAASEGGREVPAFRLTDHLGVSHDLDYQEEKAAVVLIFVDNAMLRDAAFATKMKALRTRFEPKKVLFWLANANPSEARTSIVDSAKITSIGLPVLHDSALLLAMELGVTANGTAAIIDPKTNREIYLGGVEGPAPGETATRPLLQEALDQFLAKQPVTWSFLRPQGQSIPLPHLSEPSYAKDIAPILQKNCVSCHRKGNIAPMTLANYAEVKDEADSIKEEVLAQRMPPWHADREYGKFENDTTLSLEDAAKLIRWVNAGAPRGEGEDPLPKHLADAPTSGVYPYSWPKELGQPDYIVSIPQQQLPANGDIDYVYEVVTPDLPEDVWLRAAIVLPGNTKVVHHCLTFDGSLLQNLGGLDGFFAAYVPGTQALAFPEGTGKFLPKGQIITFQMHYTTTGQAETDQTKLGLYVTKQKPARELKTEAAFNVLLNISPNAWDAEYSASKTFPKESLLYELSPHMHYRGSRFRYEAIYPNGTREVLLNVPKYYFDWQLPYRFTEPKKLPAGTRLSCVGAYDNTRFNHENPDPSARVRFGDQSYNEMFVGYINYAETP